MSSTNLSGLAFFSAEMFLANRTDPIKFIHRFSNKNFYITIFESKVIFNDFRIKIFIFLQNMLHYGTENPPSYNLSRVTAKTAIFIGEDDELATFQDAKHLASLLPNVIKLKLLDFPGEEVLFFKGPNKKGN